MPNSARLSATGHTTNVTWAIGSNPPWLTLQDNGDGTAMLRGTPPPNAGEWHGANIQVTAAGALPTVRGILVQVQNAPAFTSASKATFQVGTAGSFNPAASFGTITLPGNLPRNLLFTAGNPASIAGTPEPSTGGVHPLLLTATGTNSSKTQNLALTVNEAPSIVSPNLAVLFAGRPGTFDVTTTGFPSQGTLAVTPGVLFYQDPAVGMQIKATGLPASLQADNRNVAGLNTGTLRISGTPASADVGTRRVTIAAFNTVGATVTQTLTLQVLPFNPGSSANLLGLWTLSRDRSNNVVVSLVLANNGGQPAQNVTIGSVRIGSVSGAVLPGQIPSIASGETAAVRVVFPPSVGTAGAGSVLTLSGSFSGGTFSTAGRVVLP
ncbi:MAG: hypothetical protein JNK48_15035 [Bryobacterales bacterium]|nr:hypothetical protein [Bryobacterales bacterium]